VVRGKVEVGGGAGFLLPTLPRQALALPCDPRAPGLFR